ncbi:MAG TPA: hypothetical protein VE641_09480, partial [Chthoniobacterales bacterium]|nr:hypothetical protein [Chthoniobacterales bacterium]
PQGALSSGDYFRTRAGPSAQVHLSKSPVALNQGNSARNGGVVPRARDSVGQGGGRPALSKR